MPSRLSDALRQNNVHTMLANAALTAAASDGPDKAADAARQIHAAMYGFALGHVTESERQQILAVLQPCCAAMFFSPPAADDPRDGFAGRPEDRDPRPDSP